MLEIREEEARLDRSFSWCTARDAITTTAKV
jgi:hypothetical protein